MSIINIMDMFSTLQLPSSCDILLRKRKSLRRKLLARSNVDYIEKKIAILGGSTTADIRDMLELFLLYAGIKASFYEAEYGKFYEDAVFGNDELDAFVPDVVIVFTSMLNLQFLPIVTDDAATVKAKLKREQERFIGIWRGLTERYTAVILQNNFELGYTHSTGSLEATLSGSTSRYISVMNEFFAQYAISHSNFYIHDLHYLAAKIGLDKWHNRSQYYGYKFAVDYDAVPLVAFSITKLIKAVFGMTKKCLVLDLDNTLWGGIIGDDGVENIQIGNEVPAAEAYTEFQKYVLSLKQRGVLLAICSKNEEDIAKSGFEHPDSILRVDDFVSFKANWEPKNINIESIARELNIGLDSLVFIDDNPAERQIVRDNLPMVAVPEVDASDVFSYIKVIEDNGYFETIGISADDIKRNDTYKENKARLELSLNATSYEDFLRSLQMEAEIAVFKDVYFDRISQLTNKSNQFNLTTKRYSRAEINAVANDDNYITLYGRLKDKFGDNGLISVVIAEKINDDLHIRLWLMSCRVLRRGMEYAMLDALIEKAKDAGIARLIGYYYPTKRNVMVANMYNDFGFVKVLEDETGSKWQMYVSDYAEQNKFITILGEGLR